MAQFIFKNAKINYSVVGNGVALVLLHGFLENKKMWNVFIPQLAKKFRIISIDLLGHGTSDCLGYVHSMETQAEMVFELLSSLKIRNAVFIGHSMGGYVALAFAELYPKFISKIVLLNSTAEADSAERKTNRDRAIAAVKQNATTFVCLSIANLFSENNRKKLLSDIENTKLEALKTPTQGIIAALEGMKIRKDRVFLLQKSTCEITLILGTQDPVLNYTTTKQQIENTNVKLISLSDGHMSWIENQVELKSILETELVQCS